MSGQFIAVAVWVALQAADPVAVCVVATPPERLFHQAPTRPATPACVNERTNRHTCANRVINAYNQEMDAYMAAFDAYVEAINAYIASLNGYVSAVNDYVQCEQRRVAPQALITG